MAHDKLISPLARDHACVAWWSARPAGGLGHRERHRDLIYIDDFVEGLLKAAALDDPFLAINIASGGGVVRRILDMILRVDGWADADVRFDSTPTTGARRFIDVTLAREPRIRRENQPGGAPSTIAWYRKPGHVDARGCGYN
jgi:nucleoside-diphosphate-sugar epimerase